MSQAHLLPDQGALGIVKHMLDKEPGIDPAEAKAMADAEEQFQNNGNREVEGRYGERRQARKAHQTCAI